MKKIVCCSIITISTVLSSYAWGQELGGGLLNNQGGGAKNGTQPDNQGGLLRGVIRDQIQNAIQPNQPGGQNVPPNAQGQVNPQINGQLGGAPMQNFAQPGANQGNTPQVLSNQQGAGTSLGSQLLNVLRNNLGDHAVVGQDGTVRFRNDVNPQLRGMGILPNDQLVDSNGQDIRDLNTANSYLQANQSLRVRRNGQIVTIQQSTSNANLNSNQLGCTFGIRNNAVFISSLATNGLAARAGLRAGDQILKVNGKLVSRPEEISSYLMEQNSPTIAYVRNGQSGEVSLYPASQEPSPSRVPQSVQNKLDQIERLIGEIRAELSLGK